LRKVGRKVTGPIVDGASEMVHTVKTSVDGAIVFVKLVVAGYDRWDAQTFRKRLDKFFGDLFALSEQPGRILLDLKVDMNPQFIRSIIKAIPAIVLYPVAQGLDSIPGWDAGPEKLLDAASKVPSLHQAEQELCQTLLAKPELAVTIKDARLIVNVVEKTLELAISLLPKDLSVDVSVLGVRRSPVTPPRSRSRRRSGS
jgi:hypothetical protein